MELSDAKVYAELTDAFGKVTLMLLDWAKELDLGNERDEALYHVAQIGRAFYGLTSAMTDYNGGV